MEKADKVDGSFKIWFSIFSLPSTTYLEAYKCLLGEEGRKERFSRLACPSNLSVLVFSNFPFPFVFVLNLYVFPEFSRAIFSILARV